MTPSELDDIESARKSWLNRVEDQSAEGVARDSACYVTVVDVPKIAAALREAWLERDQNWEAWDAGTVECERLNAKLAKAEKVIEAARKARKLVSDCSCHICEALAEFDEVG